ncbi:hypothetical protein IF1G_04042 [Cordyceps javanica]|uniref:Uncharacterized protein n=1 Tax=Cordyceps javanica TaxID=43265 RepID=A0A545V509_9HYPO|nr:hypothetical protein IF1G_04042 [Cordyceps javanica]
MTRLVAAITRRVSGPEQKPVMLSGVVPLWFEDLSLWAQVESDLDFHVPKANLKIDWYQWYGVEHLPKSRSARLMLHWRGALHRLR